MTLLQTAVFLLCLLWLGSGLDCSLPETARRPQDYLRICPMCSDTHAAVRWTVREGATFGIFLLWYNCSHHNGTEMSDSVGDKCFEKYPNWIESDTGSTGVGHHLWTGVQCVFSVGYRHDGQTITESSSCYIKSPEECAENPDECNIDRVSRLNEEGECEVQCAAGYGGQLCNNIDECTSGNNSCDDNAECHDTDGSYWCQCLPGFQGDGYNCTNVDECTAGNNTCDDNAECHDTDGSYWCQCLLGFQGDGYNCTMVMTDDECLDVMCGENAECLNTEGTYSCQCKSGFTGDGYSNCTDINECLEEPHNCTDGSYCINSMGSYYCKKNVTRTEKFSDCGNHCNHSPGMEELTNTVVGVVVPVLVICGVMLVTVSLIAIYCRIKRQKMPAFDKVTKMDLDLNYKPKFWNGSVLSIQTFYEKLMFMTDISGSDEKHHESSHRDKQTKLVVEEVGDPETLDTEQESDRHTKTANENTLHSSIGKQWNNALDIKVVPPSAIESVAGPPPDHKNHEEPTSGAVVITRGEDQQATDYVPGTVMSVSSGYGSTMSSVRNSSGYGSTMNSVRNSSGCGRDSAMDRQLPGSALTTDDVTWLSQTSLQQWSSREPDLNLDNVKFTVNTHQEFEYVNGLEEKYLAGITFDILPQDNQ